MASHTSQSSALIDNKEVSMNIQYWIATTDSIIMGKCKQNLDSKFLINIDLSSEHNDHKAEIIFLI